MAINPAKLILKQERTALLICDMQTKFSKIIYKFDNMIANTAKLIKACKLLDIPMLVTEQNPEVLGRTVSQFDISGAKGPFSKMQSSMCTPEVNEALSKLCSGNRPESILLVGVEGHACVERTAVDLSKEEFNVHLVADCISSGSQEDRLYAFERLKQIGCVVETSNSVIYNLMGGANHPQFKNLLEFIRVPPAPMGLVSSPKL